MAPLVDQKKVLTPAGSSGADPKQSFLSMLLRLLLLFLLIHICLTYTCLFDIVEQMPGASYADALP